MEINSFFFGFFVIVLVNSENTNIEKSQDGMKKVFNRNFLEDIKHLSKLKDNGARDIISEISNDNDKNDNTYPKEKSGMDKSDIITKLGRLSKEVIKQRNVKVIHSNKTDAYHEIKTETGRKISSGSVRDDVKNSDRGVNKKTTITDNIEKDREVKTVQEETKETKTGDTIEKVHVITTEKDLKVKPKTDQEENKETRLEKNTDSDRGDNKEQDRQEENRNTGFEESEDIRNEEIIKETGRGNAKDVDQKNSEDTGKEGIKDTGRETAEETYQKYTKKEDDGKKDLSRKESEYSDDEMYKKVKFRNKTDNSHTTKHNLPVRIHDTKGKFADNNDQKMKSKDNILNTDDKKDIQNLFEKDTIKTDSHAYKPIKDKLTHNKEINENLKHNLEETLDITFKPHFDESEFKGSDKGKLHDKKQKTSKDKETVEGEISTIRDKMEEEKNVPKQSIKAYTVIEEKISSTSGNHLTRLSSISDRISTLASSKYNLTKVHKGVPKDNYGFFTIDNHRTNNDEFDNLTTLPKPRPVAKESVLHKVTSNLLPSQMSAKSKITHDVEVSKTPKRENVVLSWTTDSVQTRTESRSLEQNLFSSTKVEKKESITKTKMMDIAGMSKKRYPTKTTGPSAKSSTNSKHSSTIPSVLSFENKDSNSARISNSKFIDNQMSAAGNFKETESERALNKVPKTDFENNYAEKSSSGPCQAGLDPSVQYTGSALVAAAVGGVFIGAFAVLILLHLKQKCRKYVNGDYRRVPMEYDFELNPRFKNN
ncbi:uncharacterized protein LOC132722937 [Ruditapes philippinarum]|uniref:uncharacterized protein LOC132722937 n=1 Tax=Ruditapes philippinarum TaxID=129788 RepID=UPI00295BF108|nr:uncharacterized protein LOC132722937 [Ruditapes philippinarum]